MQVSLQVSIFQFHQDIQEWKLFGRSVHGEPDGRVEVVQMLKEVVQLIVCACPEKKNVIYESLP
jgi:hypothetical protein